MNLTGMELFSLAERRLAWVDRRQQVLAQNIANANTPGYAPRDLKPFSALLRNAAVPLAATSPLHLASMSTRADEDRRSIATERAPDGNAVSLDAELVKLADTGGAHQLATNLYTKYMGMFRLALGRTG